MLRPIAVWRTRASPGPGSATSTSRSARTSGPPNSSMRTARGMGSSSNIAVVRRPQSCPRDASAVRPERTPDHPAISSTHAKRGRSSVAARPRLLESASAIHRHEAMSEHLLIVGGGQAAVQAVHTLRQNGYAGRITVVCGERHAPYQRPPLSKKYLAGQMPRERLALRPESWYRERGAELMIGARAVELEPAACRVRLDGGQVL